MQRAEIGRFRKGRSIWLSACMVMACVLSAGAQVQRGPWTGAVTPHSAVVKARLARDGAVARLIVSTTPAGLKPIVSAPEVARPELRRVVSLPVTGLKPDTIYYYRLEIDGKPVGTAGRFRTFPTGLASFTFAFGSCARTASTHPVFGAILRSNPLFFMNVGDLHYLDINATAIDPFMAGYELVLSSPAQAALFSQIPFVYMWDDHDFAGNASDGNAQARTAARLAYQLYVPHYPLAFGEGDVPVCQAFSVGRVRFILTDLRSARSDTSRRDNPLKSMLGADQKAWFKQEVLAARERHALIFWVSSVPWIGRTGAEGVTVSSNTAGVLQPQQLNDLLALTRPEQSSQDHWSRYPGERRELSDFLVEHGVTNLCILHGDAHMLAADDGRNADYSTRGGARIPVVAAAPLDQSASYKGGPYSQGAYLPPAGEGCFGLVRVLDLTNRVRVIFSGRTHRHEQKIGLSFEVAAKPAPP